MSNPERSPAGSMIYRHTERAHDFTLATENEASLELITKHVETYIGTVQAVFHEIISDQVHIDILIVAPTKVRNYYTLITSGMSNLPMTVPDGAESFRFAELMLCLPAQWQVSEEAFRNDEHYWPVRSLKTIARLPHEYSTWIYADHTIPNGDPAEPYTHQSKLAGMMVTIPTTVESPKEFFTLTFSPEKEIHFFSLIPLFNEEMDYKLKHGADSLSAKLAKAGVNEIINIERKNLCKRIFGLF
jgi:hypothetical protein